MPEPRFDNTQQKTLNHCGVQAVYLFGSHAQKKAGPLSDYDYGILMPEPGHSRGDPLYFQLYDILSKISKRTLKNDTIDIVFLRDAGLEILFHIIRYGVVLYERDPKKRLDFEAAATLRYCDYRPILNCFDQTILKAL